MICDLPNKILTSITFNLVLYFMTNLRRTAGHFFVFLLFTFTCTLTMSMYFRSIGALSRSLPEVRNSAEHTLLMKLKVIGPRSCFHLLPCLGHLHRLFYSHKGNGSLVSMAQLPQC
jgi:hypothetical protein